jgi:hypothetical protein
MIVFLFRWALFVSTISDKIKFNIRFRLANPKTEHFDVYFYARGKNRPIAAQLAENAYTRLTEKFNLVFDKKIPLVIYSHPNYFTQTNIVADILPENVAGFTEFYKERVVVPFDGSYKNFEHVINHELVHVFTMQKIFDVAKSHRKRNPAAPPLCLPRGSPSNWSQGWDSQAEMVYARHGDVQQIRLFRPYPLNIGNVLYV